MESRSCQRPAALAVAAIIGLLILPLPSNGEVSCHPNIFGGQDCTSPEGRSSSTPNIFGGYTCIGPSHPVFACPRYGVQWRASALPFVVALLIVLRLGARIRFVPIVVWRAAS